MTLHLQTSGAALLVLLATPALAVITADDVWANTGAVVTALGGTLSGDVSRTAEVLTITDPVVTFALPKALGQIRVAVSTLALTENGDGTVDVLYPANLTYRLAGDLSDGTRFSAKLGATFASYAVRAAGDPGDITYRTDLRDMRYTLGDVQAPDMGGVDITMTGTMPSYTATTRITVGPLVRIASDLTVDANAFTTTTTTGDIVAETIASYGTATYVTEVILPAGGTDPMNLAAALTSGMLLSLAAKTDGSQTETVTRIGNTVQSSEATKSGASTVALHLDATALTMSGTAADAEAHFRNQPLLPAAIDMTADTIGLDFAFPVSAGTTPQPFRYAVTLGGVRLGYPLWALVDPDKLLPRDPMALQIDLSGNIVLGVDLFDFAKLMAIDPDAAAPVALTDLRIDALNLTAIGATASGTGAFTFDPTDMTTFDGFPRPQGTFSGQATGLNGLIDRAIASGLMSDDDAMAARLGLGMFTDTAGDDDLRTSVDIDAAGQVTVNGQRIK